MSPLQRLFALQTQHPRRFRCQGSFPEQVPSFFSFSSFSLMAVAVSEKHPLPFPTQHSGAIIQP